MRVSARAKPLLMLLAALVAAAGVWLFAQRVLIPHQIAEATASERPRGNLSDLYPRWLGARELLLNGRDPYSQEVTREIQEGYYGRVLDPNRPNDPKDQQGFAYPAYVVLYLAPTVHLPFIAVRRAFFWILLGLTLAAIPIWLRVLRWSLPCWAEASVAILTIGSLPIMQGLKLQQMTLLVVPLLAIAIALLAADYAVAGGIVLALATIKPQLVCGLLVWLVIWTFGDWQRRWRWAASFLITMALLCVAAEYHLPHWIPRFLMAVRNYRNYTDAVSVLDKLMPYPLNVGLTLIVILATLYTCWQNRRCMHDSHAFGWTIALVLTTTVIVIPSYALYNQIMLLPALLTLAEDWRSIWTRNRLNRTLLAVVAVLFIWPWLTCVVLATLSFVLPLTTVERAWAVPVWAALSMPVGLTALLLVSYRQSFLPMERAGTS